MNREPTTLEKKPTLEDPLPTLLMILAPVDSIGAPRTTPVSVPAASCSSDWSSRSSSESIDSEELSEMAGGARREDRDAPEAAEARDEGRGAVAALTKSSSDEGSDP